MRKLRINYNNKWLAQKYLLDFNKNDLVFFFNQKLNVENLNLVTIKNKLLIKSLIINNLKDNLFRSNKSNNNSNIYKNLNNFKNLINNLNYNNVVSFNNMYNDFNHYKNLNFKNISKIILYKQIVNKFDFVKIVNYNNNNNINYNIINTILTNKIKIIMSLYLNIYIIISLILYKKNINGNY